MKRAASPWAGVFSLLGQRPAACLGFCGASSTSLVNKVAEDCALLAGTGA